MLWRDGELSVPSPIGQGVGLQRTTAGSYADGEFEDLGIAVSGKVEPHDLLTPGLRSSARHAPAAGLPGVGLFDKGEAELHELPLGAGK